MILNEKKNHRVTLEDPDAFHDQTYIRYVDLQIVMFSCEVVNSLGQRYEG